jgi:superfamily II DNA/RNA helicase
VVIGTPGRLLDLVKRKELDLSDTRSIVLDEADRMLDMGFVDDITFLLEKTPKDRQGFFFSATLPKPIEKLIEQFGKDPVHVMVKTRDTSKNVEQDIIRVSRGVEKIDVLSELLEKSDEFKKVLIFSEMKHAVEKLSNELVKRGFKAGSIHGDKRHNERQRTLKNFKENNINILVATDVAARGLDIPDVTHVINYEIPQTYDTYVHRIGRTGRAGASGVAFSFCDHEEKAFLKDIIKVIAQPIPVEEQHPYKPVRSQIARPVMQVKNTVSSHTTYRQKAPQFQRRRGPLVNV